MKTLIKACCASVLLISATAFAAPTTGEYGNHCAYGLTRGKVVDTDCKINWQDTATKKTYCFSSEEMKKEFAKDTAGNIKKADIEYAKVHDEHDHHAH